MYYAIYFANKCSRIGRTFDTSLVKFTKFIFMDGPDHKNFMTAKISSPMVCNTVTRTIMCMCVIHSDWTLYSKKLLKVHGKKVNHFDPLVTV